ncbi:DUF5994 family protein [Mycobacteroides chelonae]|jgi:hypothetical protein|uniref:DUF5994 family protein n=2 Tax=Mycobacteroides chelonae TaxID=1774 RepID=UPI0009CFB729|nr:Uncharacterised protein [Mycobacteroides abscessus subsp. bolletii]
MISAVTSAVETLYCDDSIRLRLKPDGDWTGHLDGAWWPRSRNLNHDLPIVLDAAASRLATIKRVIYRIPEWDAAPKQLRYCGRMVSLDGYQYQKPDTIYISDLNHRRLILLIIPPMTDPHHAHDVMTRAADPDSTWSPSALLQLEPLAAARRAG